MRCVWSTRLLEGVGQAEVNRCAALCKSGLGLVTCPRVSASCQRHVSSSRPQILIVHSFHPQEIWCRNPSLQLTVRERVPSLTSLCLSFSTCPTETAPHPACSTCQGLELASVEECDGLWGVLLRFLEPHCCPALHTPGSSLSSRTLPNLWELVLLSPG